MKNRKIKASVWLPAAYLALVIVISILLLFINLHPDTIDVANKLSPPSAAHWFGTDEMGRDYLARILYGGQISLLVGILAMVTSVAIGVLIGCIAGYCGGLADSLLMRFADMLSALPWIIMVTVFGLLFRRGLASIILVIGLFSWMETARLVRAEILSVKEKEYVRYASFLGESLVQILPGHLIRSVIPTIITTSTSTIAAAIMMESSLSFLGLGVAAPMSSWGSLLQSSQKYLQTAPYMTVLPGVLIILTVFSFNQLGGSLRLWLDRVQGKEVQRGQ